MVRAMAQEDHLRLRVSGKVSCRGRRGQDSEKQVVCGQQCKLNQEHTYHYFPPNGHIFFFTVSTLSRSKLSFDFDYNPNL